VRGNAATRQLEREWAAIEERDVDALTAVNSGQMEVIDHPTGAMYGAMEVIALHRGLWRGTNLKMTQDILATLGDSLALMRRTAAHDGVEANFGSVWPIEVEDVRVFEVDAGNQPKRSEIFAADHLGEAIARLYQRHAELLPDGPERERAAATARSVAVVAPGGFDRARYAEVFRSDVEIVDHKLLGLGTGVGLQTLFRSMAAGKEVGDQVVSRPHDVLALTYDALLLRWRASGVGRESGGAFEWAFLRLLVFDADGRVARYELFDDDREAEALARFAELSGSGEAKTAPDPFENAAARTERTLMRCFNARFEAGETSASPRLAGALATNRLMDARDWRAYAARHAPGFVYRDHRRLVQLDLDRDGFLAFTRPLLEMRSTSASLDLLTTRGERLALMRSTLEMADESVGPSAIDSLLLIETDEHGAIVAYDRYEIDDQEAARAEILARWEAGEGAQFRIVAWHRDHGALVERRDWDALAALYSPAVVGHDHRLVGWGTLRGRTDFLQSLRSMEALSPDARIRGDHTRVCPRGSILSNMWVVTRDGGVFESPFLVVSELDADGKVVRIDFYDPHHFDRAWARFEELRPDPLRIPPNPATRAYDCWYETAKAGNWDALDALYGASYVFDDRRRLFREIHGREGGVINTRFLFEGGWRPVRTLLATAGERLALQRIVWTTHAAGAVSEIEVLELSELDGEGRFVRVVLFDPDARAAASAELFERYVASDAGGASPEASELLRAWNRHDLARMRALLPDDFYLDDRRRTGVGRLDGADAYLASIAAMYQLSHDLRTEALYIVTVAAHGTVYVSRWSGTNAEGGEFDAVYVCIGLQRDGRPAGLEIFEIDALDAALARFEKLRAVRAT